GRGLLLQRIAQLVEQPRVLDGDDRLGGEAGNQGDLLFSEGLDTRPPNYDDANDLIFPQHRYGEDGAMHFLLAMVIFSPPIFGVSEDIVNVDHTALQNGSPRCRSSILGYRILFHDFFYKFSGVAIIGRRAINVSILCENKTSIGAAETNGLF